MAKLLDLSFLGKTKNLNVKFKLQVK